MFSMGNGDIQPNGSGWQMATALTLASGMILLTLTISYVLSVLGAAVEQRTFALQITGMGMTAEEFVRSTWDGQGFTAINTLLLSASSQLDTLTELSLAYPILHVYHSAQRNKSTATAVVIFDEALTLLAFGIPKECRPAPTALTSARSAVKSYLDTLEDIAIDSASEVPPPPDLHNLDESAIPIVDPEQFSTCLTELTDRRRLLLGLLQYTGHQWPTA